MLANSGKKFLDLGPHLDIQVSKALDLHKEYYCKHCDVIQTNFGFLFPPEF